MRKSNLFLAAMGLFIAANLCLAQGTTASLTGTVTSEAKALPGVTVTVSSPELQGTRTKVTGANGVYNFAGLPPGEYTVVFELQGLQPVTRKVRLLLAETSRADADLSVSKVKEDVTVSGQPVAAAVFETTQIASNLTSAELNKLPVARTIRGAVMVMPGVNPNGVNNQITISGAPSYDNLFLVDGVVVGENLRGQPDNLFIEDAIQEITTLSGSISAEYGRFTGGVVSTLTKSGSNQFHGSFRDSLSNPAWISKTPYPTEADHLDKTDSVYEVTLGGRIIPDHIWFFGGGRLAKTDRQEFTVFTNVPFGHTFDEKRYEGKLTLNLTASQSLYASYVNIKNDEGNNFFAPIMDTDSIVLNRSLPNTLLALNYNGVIGKNFVAEAQYSKKKFAFQGSGGLFKDPVRGSWIQDSVRGARYNAPVFCGVCTPEERNNDSYSAKGTYFWNSASLGSHSIVLGGERFHDTRIVNNYQSASDFNITAFTYLVGTNVYPRFDSATSIFWQPIFLLSNGTDLKTYSGFINDKWDFNTHFSFNVGLRYDKNDSIDADGHQVSSDSAWSPRLGAAWDILGNGVHRVTASWGRYDAKIVDGSNVLSTAQAAGNPGNFQFRYGGPVINPAGTPNDQLLSPRAALTQLFAWFDSVGGTNNKTFLLGATYPGLGSRFEKSLKSPSVDEFTVGYGTRIGRTAFAKVDYIHRDWDNFYSRRLTLATGKVTDPFGNISDQSVTENDDGSIVRKYEGIQVQAQWTPGRFNAGGSYTYSTLKGNDDGEGAGTATIRNLPLKVYYPEYLAYDARKPIGYLPQDNKHRARFWVGYTVPTERFGEVSMTALQSIDSGRPYSAIGQIDATGRTAGTAYPGLPVNPGYTLSAIGTSHDYYFSERGAFRTDNVYSTDIGLSYSTPKIWGIELFVRATLTNAFNQSALVNPNNDVITRRTGGASSNLVPFNPFTDKPIECTAPNAAGNACTVAGANWMKGPNFGKAAGVAAYQIAGAGSATGTYGPRTYGFSFGLRF